MTEMISCLQCGKKVKKYGPRIPKKTGRKFCSDECGNRFRREKRKEFRKQKREVSGNPRVHFKHSRLLHSTDCLVMSEKDCEECFFYKRTTSWDFNLCLRGCLGGPIPKNGKGDHSV